MDIGFTEEQELLRETARKFLEAECDTKFVRARMADLAQLGIDVRALQATRLRGLGLPKG